MLHHVILDLPTPEATDHLAGLMQPHLRAGDALLLTGQIGAGKSQFCRALIRAHLGNPGEDVPSPSFTLVQTYDAQPPVWHADLYRLSHPDEVLELGLEEAFQTAITLIEWPDCLGADAPKDAIHLSLALQGDGRRAEIRFAGRPALLVALRDLARDGFLRAAGWADALAQPLAGDASARRYARLTKGQSSRILMDNPPGIADRVQDFILLDRHLRSLGLSAPEILAEDPSNGFLLLEDFGDARFSLLLDADPAQEAMLYPIATDILIAMQSHPAPPGLPNLTDAAWAEAGMLCLTHYRHGLTGQLTDPAPLRDALAAAISQYGGGKRVLIHRDYHVDNLMLLPDRSGLARVGLLDFQLAQMGHPAYDLVSLLQDARRDVSPKTEAAMLSRFRQEPGFDLAYAVWGVQRALRIIGIFARLAVEEGKTDYLHHLPRVFAQLRRNLNRPELAAVARLCDDLLPDPTPDRMTFLRSQCRAFR
jgi:N-acetylmuramate 1-kinase